MKPIVFWGATGQSIVLEEIITQANFSLQAVVDNNHQVKSPFENVPILYGKAEFEKWYNTIKPPLYFAVAIGGDKGKDRIKIGDYLEATGLIAASLIHGTSYVSSSAILGKGVQLLAQSAVCARATVGDYSIINTNASVDHECILANGVHIGPGATLAGCVEVSENSFIGTGAIVLPHIRIGKNVIVGAGAVVTKDIPDNVVCYGNPARIISTTKSS